MLALVLVVLLHTGVVLRILIGSRGHGGRTHGCAPARRLLLLLLLQMLLLILLLKRIFDRFGRRRTIAIGC